LAKNSQRFICQTCGTSHAKWAGHCDVCGGWNTIVEENNRPVSPKGLNKFDGNIVNFTGLNEETPIQARLTTGINELDRVLGNGVVQGSAILLAGDPGIGKSTLLLQAAAALSSRDTTVSYISGEEGPEQVRLRANRLGLSNSKVRLAAATNIRDILTTLKENPSDIIVIDSIQTMYLDTLDSSPGTVSQVRGAAQELIHHAKNTKSVLLLVGHVTKEGQIAGPRVLEHMVDTVLYFEGDRGHRFRIVRSIKNRFGPTHEIGVFEMTSKGLNEVANPSSLFLNSERGSITGTTVYAGVEGTRPMLMEIQALVAPGHPGSPRRAIVGWDNNRLAMILAVLETKAGLSFSANDIYLNVAGGIKISEPAADMAVAAALISSIKNKPIPEGMVFFGEIGLSGELRPVAQSESRLKESEKLGFTRALLPAHSEQLNEKARLGINIINVKEISELITLIGLETLEK
tara:strand:- start:106057 stop:107436 length:1380 start_codon:yes stop_codon:yes gene_type:complete